jgi:hypothetical protein
VATKVEVEAKVADEVAGVKVDESEASVVAEETTEEEEKEVVVVESIFGSLSVYAR